MADVVAPRDVGRLPAESFPGGRVMLATRLSSRLRGLLFSPASNDLMVLLPCRDVHTFGMQYAIDIAFLDANGEVIRAVRDVVPNRRLRQPDAVAVVERCVERAALEPAPAVLPRDRRRGHCHHRPVHGSADRFLQPHRGASVPVWEGGKISLAILW